MEREAADSDPVVHEKDQNLNAEKWSHVCVQMYACGVCCTTL